MQHHPVGVAVPEQVVDEDEIGDQLAPGVVGDHGDGGTGPRRQEAPQRRAVVGDQTAGRSARRFGCAPRPAEAEVGPVAPERGVEERGRPLGRGQVDEVVQGPEFLLDRATTQFGALERGEGVDAPPRPLAEVADRVQESAVEVALTPEERGVEPRASEVLAPPLQPEVAVGTPVVEWLDDAVGDLVQQGVQGPELPRAVREGVAHLLDQRGVALRHDAPGEAARLPERDHRGEAGALPGLVSRSRIAHAPSLPGGRARVVRRCACPSRAGHRTANGPGGTGT